MLEEKTRKRFFLFDLINSFFFFLFLHGLPISFSDIIYLTAFNSLSCGHLNDQQ